MGGLKMNKINVAIADDNQRTVEMMTELLEQESDIEVIASADDGEEELRRQQHFQKIKHAPHLPSALRAQPLRQAPPAPS